MSAPAAAPGRFGAALVRFADEVGPDGPVTAVGGRTRWGRGGPPDPAAREVVAPAGVVAVEPDELTVRVRAGTTVVELEEALGEHGQRVALAPGGPGSTVGGVLAVGWSGLRRLREGPVRDAVLEVTAVSAEGRLVRAGGPTVKNVTGYDLCRLLVGSLGTLGLVAEVVLRTRPIPPASVWLAGPAAGAEPAAVLDRAVRPGAVLHDGARTWVLLEGAAADVSAQAADLAALGLAEVPGPPEPPPHRRSLDPVDVLGPGPPPGVTGAFVAEVGVGTVHTVEPAPVPVVPTGVRALNEAVRDAFDPTRRLNPGREVLPA